MDDRPHLGPAVLAARMALATLADPGAGTLQWLWSFDPALVLTPGLPELRVAPFGVLPANPAPDGVRVGEAIAPSGPRRVLEPIGPVASLQRSRRGGSGASETDDLRPRTGTPGGRDRVTSAGTSEEVVFPLDSARRKRAANEGGSARRDHASGLAEVGQRTGGGLAASGQASEPDAGLRPGVFATAEPRIAGAFAPAAGPIPPTEGGALAELTAALWPPSTATRIGVAGGTARPGRAIARRVDAAAGTGTAGSAGWALEFGDDTDTEPRDLNAPDELRWPGRLADTSAARSMSRLPATTGHPIFGALTSPRTTEHDDPDLEPLEDAARLDGSAGPDASELAEMVNRILVEQARRAGVDLS